MATISLRKYDNNETINIQEENITMMVDTSNGTSIEYRNTLNSRKDNIEVANAITQIAAVTENFIVIDLVAAPDNVVYISLERILGVYDNGTNTSIVYDAGNNLKRVLKVADTVKEIHDLIYAKKGYITWEVESYSNDNIVLVAGEGNVTTTAISPKVITIYGSSVEENNGTYEIASSAFGGGKTTITLVAGVSDDADTTGYIMIKS